MIKKTGYILTGFLFMLISCKQEAKKDEGHKKQRPTVSDNGQSIHFTERETLSFFETEKVTPSNNEIKIKAVGTVGAVVIPSTLEEQSNIILFDNADLGIYYKRFIKEKFSIRQIQKNSIPQKQIQLERTKQLQKHGTATDQNLQDIKLALSEEKTRLINKKEEVKSNSIKLIANGFEPKELQTAKGHTAYIICDIPENQISNIKKGGSCDIILDAYPGNKYTGKINGIANRIDGASRMVKVCIKVGNPADRLKAGMYANIAFPLSNSDFIVIKKSALITVRGNHYVFIKKASGKFKRQKVDIGSEIDDRIIVFNGLRDGDKIAIKGVMQLKGLSFGY